MVFKTYSFTSYLVCVQYVHVYISGNRKFAKNALADLIKYLNTDNGQVAVSKTPIKVMDVFSPLNVLYVRCLMLLILPDKEEK